MLHDDKIAKITRKAEEEKKVQWEKNTVDKLNFWPRTLQMVILFRIKRAILE